MTESGVDIAPLEKHKQLVAQVGGLYRRLDSPRLGLSTVRRAQAANPLPRTHLRGFGGILFSAYFSNNTFFI